MSKPARPPVPSIEQQTAQLRRSAPAVRSAHPTDDPSPVSRETEPVRSLLEVACDLAAQGVPVFPCRPGGKTPLTSRGFKAATTDLEQIKEWWSEHPDANVGIPTGPASGLVVLDVDAPKGGAASLAELERRHGKIDTARVLTGGGGQHLYFRSPEGTLRNSAGQLGAGLDVRGDGGYVIAAGSVHERGRTYKWTRGLEHVAACPAWLLEDAQARRNGPAPKIEETIKPGERNATLTSLAGSMRRRGASESAMLAALQEENRSCCEPPLPDHEVVAIARSVSRYPPAISQPNGATGVAVNETRASTSEPLQIVPLDQFVAVEEPGAAALLGDEGEALLPENADAMVYGDGGVGKTTLVVDLACHLAAGDDWLGIAVPRTVRVAIVENEGPRALYRRKLRAKHEGWQGSAIDDRIVVLEEPWAQFTFADTGQRAELANAIRELEIDVVVVGPVTASGMEDAGTLQEVRAFTRLLADVREQSSRRVTFLLVHHEAKGGKVSGAWEGAGDLLLHVQGEGHGRTRLHIQKARWASSRHATTLHLRWTEGEGFAVTDADTQAAKVDAEVAEALAWIVAYVTRHPGQPRGKIEETYATENDFRGARARARQAIDLELEKLAKWRESEEEQTANTPQLATTSGESPRGTYLIPFADADSPSAEPLFGECGDEVSAPEREGQFADSPPARRAANRHRRIEPSGVDARRQTQRNL